MLEISMFGSVQVCVCHVPLTTGVAMGGKGAQALELSRLSTDTHDNALLCLHGAWGCRACMEHGAVTLLHGVEWRFLRGGDKGGGRGGPSLYNPTIISVVHYKCSC